MKSRKIYLEALLRESIRILKEQAPGSAVPPSPVPPAPATNALPPPTTPAGANPAGLVPTSGDQPKPFDVDQMIERMNVIRGGKSFADPEVYGQLTTYFKSLNDTDKASIDRFLQSINKIVIQVDTQTGQGGGAQPPMTQGSPPVAPAPAPTPTPVPGGM